MNKTMIFITCVLFYLFCGRSNAHSMDSVQQCQDSLFILTEENDTSCVSLLMFRHGCFEEELIKVYCLDGSSIDFLTNLTGQDGRGKIGVYAVYNAATDESNFLFSDYLAKQAYITPAYFSESFPVYTSLNLKSGYVILRTISPPSNKRQDTLTEEETQAHTTNGKNYLYVKAKLEMLHKVSLANDAKKSK